MGAMRTSGSAAHDAASLREAAARWHGRLNAGGRGRGHGGGTAAGGSATPADREAFARWLAESPAHAEAYAAIERAWTLAREQAEHPQILALRQEAALRLTRRSVRRRPGWPRALAASVALLALGMLGVSAWQSYDPEAPVQSVAAAPVRLYDRLRGIERYRTAVGERLNVALEDGSLVMLNTRTELRVAFTDGERKVELLRGQALFEVAKNAGRPFVVEAGNRRFVAVGTAFDVRVDPTRVQITMLEGKVKVEPVAAPRRWFPEKEPAFEARFGRGEPRRSKGRDGAAAVPTSTQPAGPRLPGDGDVVLAAGQQLVSTAEPSTDAIRAADAERVAGWRTGQVLFEDTPLADAVAELNRYSRTRIELADSALGDLRISGAFTTGRNDVFVEAVTAYFPIRAHRTSDAVFLSRRH